MGMEYQANFKKPMNEAALKVVYEAVVIWPYAVRRKSSTQRVLEMDCVPKQTPAEWADFEVQLSAEKCYVLFHLRTEVRFLKYLEDEIFPRCGERVEFAEL